VLERLNAPFTGRRSIARLAVSTLVFATVSVAGAACGDDSADKKKAGAAVVQKPLLTGRFAAGFKTPTSQPVKPVKALANSLATFTVREVLAFEQRQGKPEWADGALQEARSSRWESADDGTVTYDKADSNPDVYPLRGTYQGSPSRVSYTAEGSSQVGNTSLLAVKQIGQLDLSQDPPVMQFGWVSSRSLTAVINDTKFASTVTNAYVARVSLDRGS
jgi:hypothetical protein